MRRSPAIYAIILAAFACLSILSAVTAQEAQEARPLEPGKPLERELAGGQAHVYQLTLAADQYLHLIVEQRGVDVVVAITGPDGQKLIEVDSPNGMVGPEPVLFVAEAPGNYQIEVRSTQSSAVVGRYEVKIAELRVATDADRSRVAAERAFMAGMQLQFQGTAESLARSIEKYEEALPLYRALGDRLREAQTLFGLGRCNVALDERRKALGYYNQSLALYRSLGDRQMEVAALTNIGLIYHNLGAYQQALDHYVRVLPLNRVAGERAEAAPLNNIGLTYYSLGEYRTALDYFHQALPVSRAVGHRWQEAITLSNIGLAHDALDERRQALDYFQQALTIQRAIGERRQEAITLGSIGTIYSGLGERQKALENYNQALSLNRTVGARRQEAYTLNKIGAEHNAMGEREKAFDHHTQALAICRAVGDRPEEAETLGSLANVERQRGNLGEARARLAAAIEIVESLRIGVASQDLRASYLASQQRLYQLDIAVLMELHRRNPAQGFDAAALRTSERARARSLLGTLAEARADIRQGVDPALLERERGLQQRLNSKEQARMQLLSRKHTPEQSAAADRELRELTTQYQELQTQIRTSSPRYTALTEPQPLSLEEIQRQVLDQDTLLLEYALGEERSYLWAVSHDAIASFELPKRAEIEAAARRFYDSLVAYNQTSRGAGASKSQNAAPASKTLEAGAALSQMLLSPVAAQLGAKRLLIVADGALQYIPFAALPDPQSAIRNPQSHQPLIVEHEVVSLPSASSLAVLRRDLAGRKAAAKALAVFADPVFSADDSRLQRPQSQAAAQPGAVNETRGTEQLLMRSARESGVSGAGLRISRLSATRDEAAAIVALVPEADRKLAINFDANRAAATSDELSQYRIIHFATHGLLNSQHPELSGIVLSLVDQQGKPQDGFLRLHEIYNLKLPAELVVLSACQTGLGKEVKGEGLVGLTRGFMYAGTARVMASLWKVDDRATAVLMKSFYQGMIKDGLRPAAALRAAQVAMWKQRRWQEPYYWAAFALQGEWK